MRQFAPIVVLLDAENKMTRQRGNESVEKFDKLMEALAKTSSGK